MPYRNYPPHIQRMMIERDDLNNKIDKLGDFMIDLDKFDMLDKEDQELLRLQYKAMEEYSNILDKRLKKFCNKV